MFRRSYVAVILAALAISRAAYGEDVARPLPVDRICPVPPDYQHWRTQEIFVWLSVCAGDIADLNTEPGYGLDPKNPNGWTASRVLSSEFLETILLDDTYRRVLTRRGVRIVGAELTEPLDLANADLRHTLSLDDSRLDRGANLSGAHSSESISFDGSKVGGTLNLEGLRTSQDLLANYAEFDDVSLLGAHVEGDISLVGSKAAGTLDMDSVQVGESLLMREGATFAKVSLRAAHVGENISLNGSEVTGMLDMNALQLGGNLFMAQQSKFTMVVLTGAHVGGNLDLSESNVAVSLSMDALQLGGSLMMRREGEVELKEPGSTSQTANHGSRRAAGKFPPDAVRAGGSPLMRRPTDDDGGSNAGVLKGGEVVGRIDPKDLDVRSNASLGLMQPASGDRSGIYKNVSLIGANVGGEFDLTGAKVIGPLIGQDLQVGRGVYLDGQSEFLGDVKLIFMRAGSVFLTGGEFYGAVDLTGAQIAGEINLASSPRKPAQWHDSGSLILRNASANAIQDVVGAWPVYYDVTNFVYHNLGGFGALDGDAMGDRHVELLRAWLDKSRYSLQAYEQLATVLRAQGRSEEADDILYAGRERERRQVPATWYHGSKLWLLKVIVGYGYRLWWSLFWFAGLWLVGAVIQATRADWPKSALLAISEFLLSVWGFLRRGSPLRATKGLGRQFARLSGYALGLLIYSFEMMMPLIRLRGQTRDFHFRWQDVYFHVHGLLGLGLTTFLAAGLTGLTK